MDRGRMRHFGLVAWSAAVLAGCGFDTGGVGSGGGASIGSVGAPAETTSEAEDEGPEAGADSAPEGEGDEAPATTAATQDPTTDPTADPSGDPTSATATEDAGTSGGMIEPTTGVVDPTTGAVDPATDDGGGGGGTDPVYPTCSGANVCADATQDCYELATADFTVIANVCVPPCFSDSDCPVPETGTAMPYCSDFSFFCRLSCDNGLTCPNGMACYALTNGTNRCAYTL